MIDDVSMDSCDKHLQFVKELTKYNIWSHKEQKYRAEGIKFMMTAQSEP